MAGQTHLRRPHLSRRLRRPSECRAASWGFLQGLHRHGVLEASTSCLPQLSGTPQAAKPTLSAQHLRTSTSALPLLCVQASTTLASLAQVSARLCCSLQLCAAAFKPLHLACMNMTVVASICSHLSKSPHDRKEHRPLPYPMVSCRPPPPSPPPSPPSPPPPPRSFGQATAFISSDQQDPQTGVIFAPLGNVVYATGTCKVKGRCGPSRRCCAPA